jgi:hypothetical protein
LWYDSYMKRILLIVIILGAVYLYYRGVPINNPAPVEEDTVFCTADAMMCPDGSYVGRTGPKCQFVCPASTSTSPIIVKSTLELNKPKIIAGLNVTAWAVTEDSRCPSDVQCIQAGRAKVAFNVVSGPQTTTAELEIGKSVEVGTNATLELDEVTPYPVSTKKIADEEYRFEVTVKRK